MSSNSIYDQPIKASGHCSRLATRLGLTHRFPAFLTRKREREYVLITENAPGRRTNEAAQEFDWKGKRWKRKRWLIFSRISPRDVAHMS